MRNARWEIVLVLLCGPTAARAQDATPANDPSADALQPPATDAFTSAVNMIQAADARGFELPAFFGDLPGGGGTKRVAGPPRFAFAPVNRHAGGIRAADNESAQPRDRIYYNVAAFNRVHYSSNTDLPAINLQRHVIGIEKELFNRWASIGLRLPFVVVQGPSEFAGTRFADLSVVSKAALWRDDNNGNVVSAGIVVTVPIGPAEPFQSPGSGNTFRLSDVLLQPFLAGAWNPTSRFFMHGFSSIAVPTDTRDSVRMWNDIGIGGWVYRGEGRIRGIAPVAELHVSTPLSRRGKESTPIGYWDTFSMTWGGHVATRRGAIGAALGVPLSGPRPYEVQATARVTLNY